MTSAAHHAHARRELAELLTACRRRVHRASVAARVPAALTRSAEALAAVSVAWCLVRVLGRLGGLPMMPGWGLLIASAALAVLVPSAATLIAAWRKYPSLREAAERLDGGTADHNRIATALEISESQADSAFAFAAMHDGLTYARNLAACDPAIEPPTFSRTRLIRPAALTVGCVLIGALIGRAPGPAAAAMVALDRPNQADTPRAAEGRGKTQSRPAERPAPTVVEVVEAAKRQAQANPATRPSQSGKSESAAGKSGGGTSARAGVANRSENSRGEAGEASSSASSKEPKPSKPGRPKAGKEKAPEGLKGPKAPDESASMAQGSAGGGAMSPVQNNWSANLRTAENEQEDEDVDQPIEDENESNTQRGGVQPSLKDRQAAPNRDLGISSDDDGPPGTGRGGPTPPKKSRGTASLVLGVPVPDFVRGRLGPGSTKLTHERVEPAAEPGAPATAAQAGARSLPESPSLTLDVPPALAGVIRDYLIALHSADKPAGQPQPTANGPSAPEK